MVVCAALVGVSHPEHCAFSKGASHDLEAYWQPFMETAGDGDAWQPGQVRRDSVQVGQVHLQGIIDFLAEAKGHDG